MDIYKSSLKYAKENGELERYRESMNLCDECGTFISHSIAENFNNNFLDVKKVTVKPPGNTALSVQCSCLRSALTA